MPQKDLWFMINKILNDREKTHGNFDSVAQTAQRLKFVIDKKVLLDDTRESLDNIFSKISRIVEGDELFADHWADISGYSELCRRRCTR